MILFFHKWYADKDISKEYLYFFSIRKFLEKYFILNAARSFLVLLSNFREIYIQ